LQINISKDRVSYPTPSLQGFNDILSFKTRYY